ncbi:uncharacterized protein LOC121069290 [Cygnus olor]|uniref:uncharacterized protein LOC121069290 n=1 Tax=Cygnus olor TaxID=8869 RepID=UPI001ADE0FC0|nr:uncharacterized protein LOC121069290 [Cygnus olor]
MLTSDQTARSHPALDLGVITAALSKLQPGRGRQLEYAAATVWQIEFLSRKLSPSLPNVFKNLLQILRVTSAQTGRERGKKGFPSTPPSLFPEPELSGVRGGHACSPPLPGCPLPPPLAPGPLRARRRPREASSRRSLSFYPGVPRKPKTPAAPSRPGPSERRGQRRSPRGGSVTEGEDTPSLAPARCLSLCPSRLRQICAAEDFADLVDCPPEKGEAGCGPRVRTVRLTRGSCKGGEDLRFNGNEC